MAATSRAGFLNLYTGLRRKRGGGGGGGGGGGENELLAREMSCSTAKRDSKPLSKLIFTSLRRMKTETEALTPDDIC